MTPSAPALSRLARRLLWVYLTLTTIGMILFVLIPAPHPWTPGFAAADPPRDEAGRTNWAALTAGARVRADHWDYFRSHHPLFLIDGQPRPNGTEKWASLQHRPFPWLEIALDGTHDVEEVVVRHGGWVEGDTYTNERYAVRCYRGQELVAEVGVVDNVDAIARHPLGCPGVDRLRLDFDCTGRVDVARIYEVEAWGH